MTTDANLRPVSRRAALAGLGAGGLGSALAAVPVAAAAVARPAAAQEATPVGDLAGHPLVGTWAVQTPGGVVPQTHGPDGSVVAASPPNYLDPVLGLTFQGTALGRWEAAGERGFRFTALNTLSDADGTYVGSFLLAAAGEVSEDGQTWRNAGGGGGSIVVRDAANNVVIDEALPADLVVTATRMGTTAESVVLPVIAPGAAPALGTPTA